MPPPCGMCPKIPEETKAKAKDEGRKVSHLDAAEWTTENYQTWQHYWATKSGANPPQDAASREACAWLEQVVSLSTRKLQSPERMAAALAAMARR